MKRILILYVPVIHQGYLNLLYSFIGSEVYLLGEEVARKLDCYRYEIRAISPDAIRAMLLGIKGLKIHIILDGEKFRNDLPDGVEIFSSNDSTTREFNSLFLPGREIKYLNSFLAWDRAKIAALNPVEYDCEISTAEFDREVMHLAETESERSPDWWRQVGAILVKERRMIMSVFNSAVPSELMSYALGDPRDYISAGTQSELQTTLHCEQAIIAEAAKKGIALEGTSIYTTVFPCPVCAKLIAYSGIKNCYFKSGHAVLDGQTILKAKDVKIILVK